MIRTVESTYRPVDPATGNPFPGVSPERPAEWAVATLWPHFWRVGLPKGQIRSPKVKARVNYGRWVVDCPGQHCAGAELASKVDPRFFCMSCGNVEFGRQWLSVEFPEDHEKIEELLSGRPFTALQNWELTETIKDLETENKQLPDTSSWVPL